MIQHKKLISFWLLFCIDLKLNNHFIILLMIYVENVWSFIKGLDFETFN